MSGEARDRDAGFSLLLVLLAAAVTFGVVLGVVHQRLRRTSAAQAARIEGLRMQLEYHAGDCFPRRGPRGGGL